MDKRTRLVKTACRLFNREGFRAAGIDRILAEANVAKMTLYRHFPSKDDLAAAAVREQSARVLAWLGTAQSSGEALRLLAEWFAEKDFYGCLFSRAAQEFPNSAHPARKAVATHTRKMLALLEALCRRDGANPGAGEDLLLLVEGATAAAVKTGAGEAAAKRALAAAHRLLKP